MTTWVHLYVTQDAIDIEAGEGEDLGEFAIVLELGLEEEYLALSCANMSLMSHNIASFVDHKASLIDVDFVSTFVTTEQELDVTVTITVEHTHNLLQLESLSVVVEELGHQASKLLELAPIKSLDPILINHATILIDQEALERNKTAEFINVSTTTLSLLET